MAIENGHASTVTRLLKAGARIGDTPDARLLGAAATGNLANARRALAHGANVDTRSADDCTPLMLAAYDEEPNLVKLLLDHGADPNARDLLGDSVLKYCIRSGTADDNLQCVAFLLDHGANVNARGWNGTTVLEEAAESDYPTLVSLLLVRGADINAADKDGKTPLMRTLGMEDADGNIPVLLAHHPNLNARDKQGATALLLTVRSCQTVSRSGEISPERLLLAAGADANVADNDGTTPLMEAARSGNIALLCPLLEKGAALDLRDKQGRTALELALAGRHLDAVERLRQAGAHE